MATDDNSGKDLTAADSGTGHDPANAGTAVVVRDAVDNPGFPPHRPRVTDLNPSAERRAERTVYTLFYLSIVGSVMTLAYFIWGKNDSVGIMQNAFPMFVSAYNVLIHLRHHKPEVIEPGSAEET